VKETITLRISDRFMDYALDCWSSELSKVPCPTTVTKRFWIGQVTREQIRELHDQASHHADMKRYSEYQDPDLRPFIDVAIRAKAAIEKQAAAQGVGEWLK
jgi:hypothetical protein